MMPSQPERTLIVTFGPTRALILPRALAVAAQGADRIEHSMVDGVHRATYVLGERPEPYLHAHRLLSIAASWKATVVEIDGRAGRSRTVSWMLACAAEHLTRSGRCQAAFRTHQMPERCRSCPLYRAEWALESWGHLDPSFAYVDGVLDVPVVPEHVPVDWMTEHPDAGERVRGQSGPEQGAPP